MRASTLLTMLWPLWRYEVRKRVEALMMAAAWRCPRWLVYWCVIRAATETERHGDPSQVTSIRMLKHLGDPR